MGKWRGLSKHVLVVALSFGGTFGSAPAQPAPLSLRTRKAMDEVRQPSPADPSAETGVRIKTAPPTPDELFRLETEAEFRVRLRAESTALKNQVEFPGVQEPVRRPLLRGRGWASQAELVEPDRLCYGRLYFIPRDDERHSRSLGGLQPLVSTAYFYFDLAKLPLAVLARPCSFMQCDDHHDLYEASLPTR